MVINLVPFNLTQPPGQPIKRPAAAKAPATTAASRSGSATAERRALVKGTKSKHRRGEERRKRYQLIAGERRRATRRQGDLPVVAETDEKVATRAHIKPPRLDIEI